MPTILSETETLLVNVLIAEDDPTSALLLRKSLEKLGHSVVSTGDGKEAWQQVSQSGGHDFHLLITDWMMPEMDGMDLLKTIRAQSPASSSSSGSGASEYLYVIMLTAKGMPDDRIAALQAGADDFLVKPLDQGELVARLEVARRILTLQQDVKSREAQAEARQTTGKGFGSSGTPLGEVLVSQGVLSPEQLQMALDQQTRTGQVLGLLLIANGWANDEDIVRARAFQVEMPYVDVSQETPDPALLVEISRETARTFRLLPLSVAPSPYGGGEIVRVAVANPWQMDGLDTVQRILGKRATPFLASAEAIDAAIERAYKTVEGDRTSAILSESLNRSEAQMAQEAAQSGVVDISHDDVDTDALLVNGDVTDDAPVIRLVNALLADAVRKRASDIHVEPYKTDFEVRYRIDGNLQVVRTLPRATLAPVISRLKVMAELDIAERRLPQDGRIALKVDGRGVDLRVSTLPVQFGERVVMRVLDRASVRMSLDDLDFSQESRTQFEALIGRPHGIILVTGPTGSGKTTTLYASLNALRSPTTNLMTCEDPVEYELDRIGQSAVNVRAGLTFASQLRAILRQDPDVVLVGEIRDGETADTAFRAALTGHLVLSTLHCNEAAGAPTRLVDMGVAPFLIASALSGAVAQRLLRRICPACKTQMMPESGKAAVWAQMASRPFDRKSDTLYKGNGCPECNGTGVRGRVAVHEVLTVSDAMQAEIMAQSQTGRLRELALLGGMVPLLHDGLQKAGFGLTTMDEVQRKLFAEGMTGGRPLPPQTGQTAPTSAPEAAPAPAPLPRTVVVEPVAAPVIAAAPAPITTPRPVPKEVFAPEPGEYVAPEPDYAPVSEPTPAPTPIIAAPVAAVPKPEPAPVVQNTAPRPAPPTPAAMPAPSSAKPADAPLKTGGLWGMFGKRK